MNALQTITRHRPSASKRLPSGRSRRRAAFSLIELLIVMTLVVIMYLLYLTGGTAKMQAQKKQACQKNLMNAYVALKTFAVNNTNQFPVSADATTSEIPLSLLIPRSTTKTEFFICPGSKDKVPPQAEPFEKRRISYAYYMGLNSKMGSQIPLMTDEQVNDEAKHAGELLFSSTGDGAGSNHDKYGGVILFTDGSTQLSDTNAPVRMPLRPDVILLNPKP